MKTKSTSTFADLPKTYDGLVALHTPRVIHDDIAYDNAVEVIRALAGFKLNRAQEDYLSLMSDIVEAYETETMEAHQKATGLDSLKFILSENNLTGNDLANIIGVVPSVAYRILKGTRRLTTDHIKKLAGRFSVDAGLFI